MNENEQYLADAIHIWVRSGFYSLIEIKTMIEDFIEPDDDEQMLVKLAEAELKAKLESEASWPLLTDCDRLDAAFVSLNRMGVIALHNAGYTMSDGHSDVSEVLARFDQDKVRGYCFYHGQDVERAVNGLGLMLAFGDLVDTPEGKLMVGALVKAELEGQGLSVEWDGDPEKRINLPLIVWQRRAA